MNLLIVDDEVPAVKGIVELFDWAALSVSNVYTAYSVDEAKQKMKFHKIDILITDIEMQDGLGLDLIEWYKQKCAHCVCIILSSFPEFYYAQRAISLNVHDYLLKPIDDAALEKSIKSAVSLMQEHSINCVEDDSVLINKIKDYISANLSHDITRDEISRYVSVTPDYLSKLFKRETNFTVSEYIIKKRISVASELLAQTDISISEIAERIGFETASYFSTTFKHIKGTSPSRYRKQKRGY